MKPRLWLITGFEPFAGRHENSSELLLNQAPSNVDTLILEKRRLPVRYDQSVAELTYWIDLLRPEGVICLGEALNPHVRLERWARSQDDSKAADNAGVVRAAAHADAEALPSRLDLESFAEAFRDSGVPVHYSDNAGGFVCNHVFYGLQKTAVASAGFIHVPVNYRAYFTAQSFWQAVARVLAQRNH